MFPSTPLTHGGLGRNKTNRSSGSSGPSYTFSNVKLLVHGSSQPFIDASSNKRAVCNWQKKCSVSSSKITFSETVAGLMCAPTPADIQFGSGSWFVSAKVSSSASYSAAVIAISCVYSASSLGWQISVDTSRRPLITIEGTTYGAGTPSANLLMTGSGVECTMSFSYDGTSLRCFVDGVLSWTHTVALNIDTSHRYLWIGNQPGSSSSTTANPGASAITTTTIREVIIVKGESVATADFTVPSSWTDTGIVLEEWNPTTYSNVKLNCHMSGTNGGTTFTDTSTGAKTVSRFGNAQTSTAQARIGSSSGLFDGTGDYLTVPDSADWDFGTGAFGVEVQIRPASVSTHQCVISNYQDPSTGWTQQINLTTNSRWYINLTGDGPDYDSGSLSGGAYLPIQLNTWQHIAFSRVVLDGTNTYLMAFYEGECIFMTADSQNITGSAKALFFGRLTDVVTTIDYNGYAQELRVIKGEGHPRSFTLQSAAHPDS